LPHADQLVTQRHVPGPNRVAATGRLIRRRREAAGLTQRELAHAARISLGALRDLEQGRTQRPRQRLVENLAHALGLTGQMTSSRPRASQRGGPRTEVSIGVLGPLTATSTGLPAPLGPERQRAVLALLALYGGDWLHRDAIVDALWPERPPASAVTKVQAYVSALRAALDPVRVPGRRSGVIVSAGQIYRLGDEADTDLAAFTRLAGRGRDAATCGDQVRAATFYAEALMLWRGHPAADIGLLRRHPLVTELRHRHTELVLRHADLVLGHAGPGQGGCAQVLPHLRGLCEREPFNEPAQARLMIALATDGQRTAALGVYHDLCHRLDTALGLRPSTVLVQAHLQVLRQQG
jgi:DNA-binding SARP family transcriptional activator/DNA-binding XRE family transcriptional regulator